MQKRMRFIKPEYFEHEELAALGLGARVLFPALWCVADREGRFPWKPRVLKINTMPWDSDKVFDSALELLVGHGYVVRYEADGKEYAYIANWDKHQRPNQREQASSCPAPPCPGTHVQENARTCTHVHARASTWGSGSGSGSGSASPPESPHDTTYHSGLPAELLAPSAFAYDAGDEAPPDETGKNIFIWMPVSSGEVPITEDQVLEWEAVYGKIDVRQALRKMRLHWLAKPRNQRKSSRGIRTSINTWLSKDHDRAVRIPERGGMVLKTAQEQMLDRNKEALAEAIRELEGGDAKLRGIDADHRGNGSRVQGSDAQGPPAALRLGAGRRRTVRRGGGDSPAPADFEVLPETGGDPGAGDPTPE